jgi:glutathione peroxidase
MRSAPPNSPPSKNTLEKEGSNHEGRTIQNRSESLNSIYEATLRDRAGGQISMESFRGKVLLIVNVASRCGFTPQYAGLQKLYERFQDRGLEILGFPCNQFGGQEPGSDADIGQFCSLNYGVTFPVLSKIQVNGSDALPLYQFLKKEAPGLLGTEAIKWNFTKFLVDRDGKVIARFAPNTTPDSLAAKIEELL